MSNFQTQIGRKHSTVLSRRFFVLWCCGLVGVLEEATQTVHVNVFDVYLGAMTPTHRVRPDRTSGNFTDFDGYKFVGAPSSLPLFHGVSTQFHSSTYWKSQVPTSSKQIRLCDMECRISDHPDASIIVASIVWCG